MRIQTHQAWRGSWALQRGVCLRLDGVRLRVVQRPALRVRPVRRQVVHQGAHHNHDDGSKEGRGEDELRANGLQRWSDRVQEGSRPTRWMHGVRPFLHGDGQSDAEGRGGPDHALQPDERHDRDHENAHGTADGVADDRVRGLRQGCFASGEDEHGHGAEGSDLHLQVEPRRENVCVQQAQHTHASEGAQETEERLHQLRLRGGITSGAGKLREVHPEQGGFVLGAALLVRLLDL
mmetsp:Transcript_162513/g.516268  ORF Transcript_162513/g.516268 Transcript_162513/m.516268 type:complete len:235 (+) Transcript_162513:375-1079(+)